MLRCAASRLSVSNRSIFVFVVPRYHGKFRAAGNGVRLNFSHKKLMQAEIQYCRILDYDVIAGILYDCRKTAGAREGALGHKIASGYICDCLIIDEFTVHPH